jgi:general secretion pathway protein L
MRVSPIADDPGHVAVDVAVVSRALLDDLVSSLGASGSKVTAASAMLFDGEEVDIDLGSDDIRLAAEARAGTMARAVAALLVLLAGLGLFAIYRTNAETARLEQETAAAMTALRPSGALAGEPPLVAAANRLHQLRAGRLPAVAVVDDLSKLLPDNVYLTFLGLNGDEIALKGQGSGVPALVSLLESSPFFDAVNFAAATELDENSKVDSFSLSARLEKAP